MSTFREYDLPFEGTTMHVWHGGKGTPVILMHGSGPGVGTMSNFKRLLPLLSGHFEVIAIDKIGYGQSGRRLREPYFDMSMWAAQVHAAHRHFAAGRRVGLLGHSLAGAIMLKVAVSNPDVLGVLVTATMGVALGPDKGPTWPFPEDGTKLGQYLASTMFDPSLVDREEPARRRAVLYAPGYQQYFERMFGEPSHLYMEYSALTADELARITCPVVLMHGANDDVYTLRKPAYRWPVGCPTRTRSGWRVARTVWPTNTPKKCGRRRCRSSAGTPDWLDQPKAAARVESPTPT